ncbi:OmpA family protein [Siphonobacter sp.]|uniref:OmpA family protein n=1 Tax=Siphonobacter sp. TaxID=1869184 RepID=UPI003B3B742D
MDLIQLAQAHLNPSTVDKISDYLNESTPHTAVGLNAALPAILGGFIEKATTPQGLSLISDVLQKERIDSGLSEWSTSIKTVLDIQKLISRGSPIVETLFNGQTGNLINRIASIADISHTSSSSLLSIAASVLTYLIGKEDSTPSGLFRLFTNQKESVLAALPAGLTHFFTFSQPTGFVTEKAQTPVAEASKSSNSWLLWLLLLLAIIAGIYFFKSCTTETEKEAGISKETQPESVTTLDTMVIVHKKLSTGVDLSFGEASIENQLIQFIEDEALKVDKTTWFNFRKLTFKSGSNEIDSTSMEEVRNIYEIMQAYPEVHLKIGGYTDNTGSAETNLKLSQERARNVQIALEKMGISSSRLDAEGYGQEHPIASNETQEGRDQNRRIAVRVTRK